MMPHPIHLHGMFFDLVNGGGMHRPRKHTLVVKPGEKVSVDISADHVGDWAFHCHLLFHIHAGMMQVVSILLKAQTRVQSQASVEDMQHKTPGDPQTDEGLKRHGSIKTEGRNDA